MRKLVALLAVLGMVSVASAGITVSGNLEADGVDVGDGLRAYTVSLTYDQAIYAMDFKFTGPMATHLISGLQSADAQYMTFDTNSAQDSHFLINGSYKGVIFDPEKGMLVEDEEAGTLTGIFGSGSGFNANESDPSIETTFDLAYIVLPEGECAVVTSAYGANPAVADKMGVFTDIPSFVVGVPEPATLGLLAMGVVGLLRKRA